MERLKIGIPAWCMGGNSFGVTKSYLSHLQNYGDPVILSPMRGMMPGVDLIFLPGGKDVSSHLYNEPPHFMNSDADQYKEYFMRQNLPQYIKARIPVWGTCLGLQQLVVHFGGRLVQDIDGTHGHSGENRAAATHTLTFTDRYKGLEKELLKLQKNVRAFKHDDSYKWVWTNSLHHQGVNMDELPTCFELIAHTDDGIVEAIKHKELPIIACQFHVEEDYNVLGEYLFSEFVNLVKHERSNIKLKGVVSAKV